MPGATDSPDPNRRPAAKTRHSDHRPAEEFDAFTFLRHAIGLGAACRATHESDDQNYADAMAAIARKLAVELKPHLKAK